MTMIRQPPEAVPATGKFHAKYSFGPAPDRRRGASSQAPSAAGSDAAAGKAMSHGAPGNAPPAIPEQDVESGPIAVEVALPSGEIVSHTVDKSTPVMDFIVQLTRSHKLSTADHVLSVLSEDTGRPVDYASGQHMGPLLLLRGRKRLLLLSKADMKRDQQRKAEEHRAAAKFETTNRVLVSLPRGVKAVYRMKLDLPVGEAFKMACADKGLDPARYFVSLPALPAQPIDLATPLAACGKNEICIVERPPLPAAAAAAPADGTAVRSLSRQTSRDDELGPAQTDKVAQQRRNDASSGVASAAATGGVPTPPQGPTAPAARAPRKKYAAPPPPPRPPPSAAAAAPDQRASQKPGPLLEPDQRGQQAAPVAGCPKDYAHADPCAAGGDRGLPASAVNGGGRGGHSRQSSDSSGNYDAGSLSSGTSGDAGGGVPPPKPAAAERRRSSGGGETDDAADGSSESGGQSSRKSSVGSYSSRRNKARAPSRPSDDVEISAL